jgi:hypothetical protein
MRRLRYGLVQEVHGLFGGRKQGFDFFAQFGVAVAVFLEKLRARFRLQFESLIKQSLDLSPPI